MVAKLTAGSFHLTNIPLGKGLPQNAPKFYYEMRLLFLLQNAAAFLLQNAPMLLQNAAGITKCDITKCDIKSSVTFSQDDIAKITQKLDSGKVHGHDNISIRMLKICVSGIYKPLAMIFNQLLIKGDIVPIRKKGDKQTLNF